MAIITKVEPQDDTPVFNEVVFVFDSTNKTKDKFEYVIRLDVNGSEEARLKIQTNPQGVGIVDLSKHLQNYIGYDLPTNEVFQLNTKYYIDFDIKVAENFVQEETIVSANEDIGKVRYSTSIAHSFVVGDFVIIENATESSYNGLQEVTDVQSSNTQFTTTKNFVSTTTATAKYGDGSPTLQPFTDIGSYVGLNVVNKWDEVWDEEDFEMVAGNNGKFLTNLPYNSIIREDDSFTLNYKAANIGNLTLKTSNGSEFAFCRTSASQFCVNIGIPALLNTAMCNGNFLSQSQIDNAKWYTIELKTIDGTVSEIKRFTIDRSCANEDATTLTYLNRFGSWSVFHFLGSRTKQVSAKKTTYRKSFGGYNTNTETYDYNTSDRGLKVLDVDNKETHTINSLYMKPEQADLIEDLLKSPEVFEAVSGELYAINLKTSSVKIKKRSIDKLLSYSVDFEYSNKNKAQR